MNLGEMYTGNIPSNVYHYCTLDSFLNIIQTQKIRFGLINHFRDTSERKYLRNFYKEYSSISTRPYIDKVNQLYDEDDVEFEDVFVLCFSKHKDLLSQWRAYAGDGTGLSLGFSSEYFAEFIDARICKHPIRAHAIKSQIYYHMPHKMKLISKVLEILSEQEDQPETYQDQVKSSLLRMLSVIMKDEAFSEESEIRYWIIHKNIKNHLRLMDDPNDIYSLDHGFFRRNNRISPFFERSIRPYDKIKEHKTIKVFPFVSGKLQCTKNGK